MQFVLAVAAAAGLVPVHPVAEAQAATQQVSLMQRPLARLALVAQQVHQVTAVEAAIPSTAASAQAAGLAGPVQPPQLRPLWVAAAVAAHGRLPQQTSLRRQAAFLLQVRHRLLLVRQVQ